MFNVKRIILNLSVLSVALCASRAGAQVLVLSTTSEVLSNGSTVYLTATPGTWQPGDSDMENNIARDGDGNIYLAGTFTPADAFNTEIYVRKISPAGVVLWTSTFTEAGNDYGRGVALDGVGNVYALGITFGGVNKIMVAKYNAATGAMAWSRVYNSGLGNNAYDIVADANFAYVAGVTNINKIAVIKFAGDNLSVPVAVNYGGADDAAYAIDLRGGVLALAGFIYDSDYGREIWVAKFNAADLSNIWASTYAPVSRTRWGTDEARAVKIDDSGNIYAAGFFHSDDSGRDIWLGKYNSSGELIYARTKNGPSNGEDNGFGLALDSFGHVYVTGKVFTISQGDDLWLGKYSPAGALISEINANRGWEAGYDVEVSTGMVVVGGGFGFDFGLLNVYPGQFGAPQQLFAGPGLYTGSVNLSWVFEDSGAFSYKVQYSTSPAFVWNKDTAQISVSTNIVSPSTQQMHPINGLPVRLDHTAAAVDDAVDAAVGPLHYFRVWTSSDAGVTWIALTNTANSAPNAPHNYWMDNVHGQDGFRIFVNSYGSASAITRDASGNTYAAYGLNMGGLAITKFNRYDTAEWTSFSNFPDGNANFTVGRLVMDAQGAIYAAGAIAVNGGVTAADAWLAKFNPYGVKIWERVLPGVGMYDDFLRGIVFDASNNVYAAGGIVVAGASEMLLAKYSADGVLQSSFTYKPALVAGALAYGLAIDASSLYVSGSFSKINGLAMDLDAAVVKYDHSLGYVAEQSYVNASALNVPSGDMLVDMVYGGGYLYATGVWDNHAGSNNDNLLVTKIDTGTLAQVWASTYNSVDNDTAVGYGIRLSSGSLYVAGYENRITSGRNILLRKLTTTGQAEWTKSLDGVYDNQHAMAFGLEVGSDGYFYLSGLFNVDVSSNGQAGIAKVSEPMSGIGAREGPKPCSVQLSWIADTELPAGTTFYVHYATYPGVAFSSAAAQYSFFTGSFNFNGSYIGRLVPGLEAGNGTPLPGQSNIDSPRYYFRLGYKKPADVSVTTISGSTDAVANTPGTWDRMDRYPNGRLYVVNNAHGERFPLVLDSSGNIYTAGSFNAWGRNSDTAYVRKFSPGGVPLWTRYYSDEYNNSAPVINALALDADGNLYAAGTHGSDMLNNLDVLGPAPESATKKDILLIKYNSSGRMLWRRSFDAGSGFNESANAVSLADGAVFVGGFVQPGPIYPLVLKYSADGSITGAKAFTGAAANSFVNGFAFDGVNSQLLAVGSNGTDTLLMKIDPANLDNSTPTAAGIPNSTGYGIVFDSVTQRSYVAGSFMNGANADMYLIKLSSGWNPDAGWVSSLHGATVTYNSAGQNMDEGRGVALDGLGGVYVSGMEYRYDLNQGKNIFVRKYNTDGDLIWSQALNSAGNNEDTAGAVAADPAGNVFTAVDAAQLYAMGMSDAINGAGYFRHTQFNMITTNPRLTVRVNKLPGQGLAGVAVAVMSFNQTGGMDPNGINLGLTDSSGAVTMSLPSGRGYFVAISSHNMVPTISEQISDPGGNFFVELNADATREYYISHRQSAADPVYKMTIQVSSLTVGDYVMGEVFINNTAEKVAYSIIKASAATHTMEIGNLGAAANGVYGMAVSVPARNRALQLFMKDSFPSVNYYAADMGNAMSMATGFAVGGSTNPPSVAGLVSDVNYSPIEGARVRLEKISCIGVATNTVCNIAFRKENLTDVSGRYSFYDVPASDTYNLNVGKAGYESGYSRVTIPAPVAAPVPLFEDFQLALATYTLTGVLKYNGMPLPNATIMVHPDWEGYPEGTDSYRFCEWGGCGIRSDARVRTGADGSFTVAGVTDGNARIEASFEGGWRSLNDGNSDLPGDNLRVTVSSQGAAAPASPPGNPCRPGRAWVVNSSGSCVTAGSVVFNIIPENANTAGLLYGNLTFITTYTVSAAEPLMISTSSPLTLMAQESCRDDCENSRMGFTSLAGAFTSNTTGYAITLSTGVTYYPRVFSSAWAKAASFDSEVELTSAAPSVRQDISVVRAGGLLGVIKFPDGSNFKPVWGNKNSTTSYWGDIRLEGVNVDVHEGKGVDENGEFEFPNLAPGTYKLTMQPRGAGFVWASAALDSVGVTEGQTTEVELQLESGLAVKPQIYGLPEISTPSWGYFVIGVESGEEMTQKKITDLFFSKPKYSFDYSTATGWRAMYMPAGQYDFYLMMGSRYDPGDGDLGRQSFHQFANFIGRIKGMSVQKSDTNPNIGTAAQPVAINILGAVGQAQIAGTMQGSRIFMPADLERLFDNFKELFPLIPAIMLYDTAGDLRGFANAMPNEASFPGFEAALAARDTQAMLDYLAGNPMNYGIWGLPPGRYTAVFANPNYPPVAKEITLPGNASYVFNFDDEQVITGSISGVVKSSATGMALGGARVYLNHRIVEKFMLTDSSGNFSFANLPTGIYRLEVARNGYVTTGRKTSLAGNDSVSFNKSNTMYLLPSESKLSGRLFMSKFPAPVTRDGVQLVAYDETLNVKAPSAYLPKTEVQTDASGNYEITGVIPGHLYKLSAFYQGKLPTVLEVTAQEGNTVVNDITLKDTPPQITIKVKKSGDSVNKVDVVIKSPKQLISIPSCQYNPGVSFSSASAVTLMLVPGPGKTYLGQFTATSGQQYYTVKVTAGDGNSKMVKEFVYDQVSNAKTEQYIQEESLAGGEIQMDKETEEYSGIELDPGALSYSTAAAGAVDFSNLVGGFFSSLPSVRTVKTAKGSLSISDAIQSLMASEVYNIDLSNASANKPFTLTLKYDKEKGSGSQGLRIYQYDEATASWKEVPGNYTVDPMLGVVSVDVASLTQAYEGTSGAATPLGRKRFGMSAVANGRYMPSATDTAQAGKFSVFTAMPGAGTPYSGSEFDVYNMPNPFSLKFKDVIVSADGAGVGLSPGARSTKGTLIKYHLPAGKSGSLKFVIYNVAGEKVRTLDEGSRTGGAIFYSEWDGKNDTNQDCASGAYFMLTYLNGNQLGGKAHKMAIIK